MRTRRPAAVRPAAVRLAVGVLAVALLAAGCGRSVSGVAVAGSTSAGPTTSGSTGPTTATTADIGPVPSGLESYYRQQLAWGDCEPYASSTLDKQVYGADDVQCARMKVPVDYARPDGQQAEIGVLRARSTGGAGQRIGSVVFNPGGPGGSGMSIVAQFAAYGVGKDLRQRFDLVGFDPRGTGASIPRVECNTDAERDEARASTATTATQQGVDEINAQAKATADRCFARTGEAQGIDGRSFLANIGTRDVARDIDMLRAVLGDRKLTFVGYSYGTRLGTEYAEKFTGNVRAMVLDGVVDPTQDDAGSLIAQATSFQKTFEAYAASCAQQPDCPLGTDPAAATRRYQQLVRPLVDTPLKLSDGRVITFGDATTGTIQALYSDALWPQLTRALSSLAAGKGDQLMQLADQYEDRDADGHYSPLQDAFTAINCVDRPRGGQPTDGSVEKKYYAAAPFTDPGLPVVHTKDVCDYWQVPPTYTPHTPQVSGLPTVLVVSTTGDPATPYQAGVDLAGQLKASLLTVVGDRHTAYLGAMLSCVDDIGDEYLIDLKAPAAGARCS